MCNKMNVVYRTELRLAKRTSPIENKLSLAKAQLPRKAEPIAREHFPGEHFDQLRVLRELDEILMPVNEIDALTRLIALV